MMMKMTMSYYTLSCFVLPSNCFSVSQEFDLSGLYVCLNSAIVLEFEFYFNLSNVYSFIQREGY